MPKYIRHDIISAVICRLSGKSRDVALYRLGTICKMNNHIFMFPVPNIEGVRDFWKKTFREVKLLRGPAIIKFSNE